MATIRQLLKAVEKWGALLVFPIKDKPQYPSIWSELYPRTRMVWDWDDTGSPKVHELWHLRNELSESGKAVYSKWFRGRATFFSKKIYTSLLASNQNNVRKPHLGEDAQMIYEILAMDSPQSTKSIKRQSGLIGKFMAAPYERAMRELWRQHLIVGYGEVDDGAFPSLAVGRSDLLFEELWRDSQEIEPMAAQAILEEKLERNYLDYHRKYFYGELS